MNYLVTGGCGFLGSYVVSNLLSENEDVVIYDLITNTELMEELFRMRNIEKRPDIYQGDITDSHKLFNVINENGIDKIIHLASPLKPDCEENPWQGLQAATGGTISIFEAAKMFDVERVVWASSVTVFGPPSMYSDTPIPNDAPHYPQSNYGAYKSLNERLANYYFEKDNVDNIGLRYTDIYGYGRKAGTSSFTTKMIEAAALGEKYRVPFLGDRVDWQFVEDVARLTVKATRVSTTDTRVFNTKGETTTVRDGLEFLRSLPLETKFETEEGIFGVTWDLGTEKLEDELDFRPEYSMKEGVMETLNAYRTKNGLDRIDNLS